MGPGRTLSRPPFGGASRKGGRPAALSLVAGAFRSLILPALAVLAATSIGCARDAVDRYPRVVLVTLDTLHVLQTGVYDPENTDTPELDRLASAGVVFEQARTTVPMTLPSHASMLSGRTPVGMRLLRNGQTLDPEVETLAQRLSAAGYRTGAFLSLGTLRREFQLDRGFEVYEDGYKTVPRFYRRADEVYADAAPWVEARGEEPYFLWLHLSDPHEPYLSVGAPPDVALELDGRELGRFSLTSRETHRVSVAVPPGRHELRWVSLRSPRADDLPETSLGLSLHPDDRLKALASPGQALSRKERDLAEPYAVEFDNAAAEAVTLDVRFDGGLRKPPPSEVLENYAAEVRYVDEYLGRLRRLVESVGPALWIVASDHGEGIYRHDQIIGHAGFGHENQLRILWVMQGRGIPAGKRVIEPALAHDLAPTVLDLLGLPPLEAAEGVSLRPCWERGDCPAERRWFAHGFHRQFETVSAVAVYHWPLKRLRQRAPGSGGYHLLDDPWERRDLTRTRNRQRRLELRRLDREVLDVTRLLERLLAEEGTEPSPEDLEMLRALGYLGD